MKTAAQTEQTLVLLLRFLAILELLAIPTVMLPLSWMAVVHEYLGLGQLPDAPIVSYLARSVSVFYSFHGAIVLFMSRDVRRYWPLIRLWAVMMILMGIFLLTIDVALKMPIFWIISEGPFAIVLGGIVLWLQRIGDQEAA